MKFKQFNYVFPRQLRNLGFEDTSYSNDVCASCEGHGVRIWVMPLRRADRVNKGNGTDKSTPRFRVVELDPDVLSEGRVLLETERLADVVRLVSTRA